MASDLGAVKWHSTDRSRTTKPHDRGRLRVALAIVTAGLAAFYAPLGHAQQSPSAGVADAVAQPATQGPAQAEMDNADPDPGQWLTDKGSVPNQRSDGP
jgi:hypothetical protein